MLVRPSEFSTRYCSLNLPGSFVLFPKLIDLENSIRVEQISIRHDLQNKVCEGFKKIAEKTRFQKNCLMNRIWDVCVCSQTKFSTNIALELD